MHTTVHRFTKRTQRCASLRKIKIKNAQRCATLRKIKIKNVQKYTKILKDLSVKNQQCTLCFIYGECSSKESSKWFFKNRLKQRLNPYF